MHSRTETNKTNDMKTLNLDYQLGEKVHYMFKGRQLTGEFLGSHKNFSFILDKQNNEVVIKTKNISLIH